MIQKWYDVHFSLIGFHKMQAESSEEACQKVEDMLLKMQAGVERVICTGVGVEVTEAVEEGTDG